MEQVTGGRKLFVFGNRTISSGLCEAWNPAEARVGQRRARLNVLLSPALLLDGVTEHTSTERLYVFQQHKKEVLEDICIWKSKRQICLF